MRKSDMQTDLNICQDLTVKLTEQRRTAEHEMIRLKTILNRKETSLVESRKLVANLMDRPLTEWIKYRWNNFRTKS